MKGFRLILTLLIAGTFAFGTIACDKPAEEAKPEAPAEETKDDAKPEEKKDDAKPAEAATNAAKPAEGGTNAGAAAAEGEEKEEPKGGAESQ